MSHLCTMHRTPLSSHQDRRRPLWGEKFTEGEDKPLLHLQSTNNTSASPSSLQGLGANIFEESTFHITPSFSDSRRSSALTTSSGSWWSNTPSVGGEAFIQAACLGSGQWGRTLAVSSMEGWHHTPGDLCFVGEDPVCSSCSELEAPVHAHLRTAAQHCQSLT